MVFSRDINRNFNLLFLILILMSCISTTESAFAFVKDLSIISRSYTGAINNKFKINIVLEIWQDGVVNGHYYYTKNGIVIPLDGRFEKDMNLLMTERAPRVEKKARKEDITGTFKGVFSNNYDELNGSWSNYDGKKTYPFKATRIIDRYSKIQTDKAYKTIPYENIIAWQIPLEEKRLLLARIENVISSEDAEFNNELEEDESYTSERVKYSSRNLLSVLKKLYYRGATHSNTSYSVLNYWIHDNHASEIKLTDLFLDNSNYKQLLSQLCFKELKRQGASGVSETDLTELYKEMNEFVTTPIGLAFYFSPYSVGSYAEGEFVVEIPYQQILPIVKKDGPLAEFFHQGKP